MNQTSRQGTEDKSRLQRLRDSDIWASFTASWVVVGAAIGTVLFFFIALFAPLIAPNNPFDPASIDILNASIPPAWLEEGNTKFRLGTDDQGRDILSTIIYGARISLFVDFASVIFSMILGVGLGLISGYVRGRLDNFIM